MKHLQMLAFGLTFIFLLVIGAAVVIEVFKLAGWINAADLKSLPLIGLLVFGLFAYLIGWALRR